MHLTTLLIFFCLVMNSCFSETKRNLEKLKECDIRLVNVIIRTEPTKGLTFIPNITIVPIVSVMNPNDEDVDIYRFNLNLSLITKQGAEPIGMIRNFESIKIPKNSTLEFPLTLELEQKEGLHSKFLILAFRLITSAANNEEAEFLIKGFIDLNSVLGEISLPVSETQKIKLKN